MKVYLVCCEYDCFGDHSFVVSIHSTPEGAAAALEEAKKRLSERTDYEDVFVREMEVQP